jgi:hypothetical protein
MEGVHQRVACSDAELVVGGGEVGFDGLDAQEQLLRDCAVRRSGGGQIADLALARRERTDALGLRTPRPQPG